MTTQNIHPEESDVEAAVVEQSPAPENTATPEGVENVDPMVPQVATASSATQAEVDAPIETQQPETQAELPGEAGAQLPGTQAEVNTYPELQAPVVGEEMHDGNSSELAGGQPNREGALSTTELAEQEVALHTESVPNRAESGIPTDSVLAEESSVFSYTEGAPVVEEEVVRPFTEFIAEFRQAEMQSSTAQEPQVEPFSSFVYAEEPGGNMFILPWESESPLAEVEGGETIASAGEERNAALITEESGAMAEEQASILEQHEVDTTIEQAPEIVRPPVQAARPVSPLLRPAAPRVRLPRHGGNRQREEFVVGEAAASVGGRSQVESAEVSETPADIPPTTESAEEQPRPARRYRFDRPAPVASTGSPTPQTTPIRAEESKEMLNRASTTVPNRLENGHSNNSQATTEEREVESPQQLKQAASQPQVTELQTEKQPGPQEPEPANGGAAAPVTSRATQATPHDRRRRHNQDRQRENEQPASTPPPVAVVTEAGAPVAEPVSPQSPEIAPEDLPPLEYSELQAATSRRRRRRRAGSGTATPVNPTAGAPLVAKSTTPEGTPPPVTPSLSPAVPRNSVAPVTPAAAASNYNIVSGYTVNQMNQGNDNMGPFMGPEPSPARGSTGGSGAHNVRPIRTEAQRSTAYPVRTGEGGPSAASMNHFANIVSQAIQTQTDRMVAELRRANQVPTNVSVSLPPFPSTERVGVFVDVANLLYSARTLRINVDFGKLLDFLRGNRRLVRAHAYTPTSPQVGDEQMFLQAVKGLGYRITTKNYKTFSSGAKKADLDLDLCMDVVRLVDGKAVDCIVLVSGDSDFMPMLDYCSDHGVRVEVAAFDEAMSATLRQSCDLFINLSMLDEIRA